jgi:hypothetical protein
MLFVATRDDLITLVTEQVMSRNVNVSVPDPEVPMVAVCDKAEEALSSRLRRLATRCVTLTGSDPPVVACEIAPIFGAPAPWR